MRDAVSLTKHCETGVHRRVNTRMLDRCDILRLRKSSGKPLASVLGGLKELGILKYRGPGKRRDGRGSDKFGCKIDVCIVTETHLQLDQPDAVVSIVDFNI